MTNRLTVGSKLFACVLVLILLTALLGFSSMTAIQALSRTLHTSVNRASATSDLIGHIGTGLAEMKAYAKMTQFAYTLNSVLDSPRTSSCIACHVRPDKIAAQREFETLASAVTLRTAGLRKTGISDESLLPINAIDRQVAEWTTLFGDFTGQVSTGNFEAAHTTLVDRMDPLRKGIETAVAELERVEERELASARSAAGAEAGRARTTALVLVAISLCAAVSMLYVVRTITRALRQMTGRLSRAAAEVSGQACQISSAGLEFSEGSTRQASAVDEIRTAGASVDHAARSNVGGTREMAAHIHDIRAGVKHASETIALGLAAMNGIEESSRHIGKIIRVIDEIAFQTNLLALNAAVEAARAGTAGQGFAVVADEVRSLAARCASAAKETESLIRESIERSGGGKDRLEILAGEIGQLVVRSEAIDAAVVRLESLSVRQSQSVAGIGRSLDGIAIIAGRSAASATETAKSGQILEQRARDLSTEVASLVTLVGRTTRE